jgi:hypothetical protein
MLDVGYCLPGLPGMERPKSYAPWRVWSQSTTKEVRFQGMPKKVATKLFHRARDFDRQTRQPGKHGGAIGHAALQVLHALLFDFLNYATGQLDPSYAKIAQAANVCERTVANAVRRLRDLGILNWVRRCEEGFKDGRFVLEQISNAYAVLPATQWRGYRPPEEPPATMAGTWGDHPALPPVLSQAVTEQRSGSSMRSVLNILDSDPGDIVAMALASLGKALQRAKP